MLIKGVILLDQTQTQSSLVCQTCQEVTMADGSKVWVCQKCGAENQPAATAPVADAAAAQAAVNAAASSVVTAPAASTTAAPAATPADQPAQ